MSDCSMNSMDLHYVPELDVLRLVLRADGMVLEVLESSDPKILEKEIKNILRHMPELKAQKAQVNLPRHVCVKVWI